jgi:hypothetical protein
LSWPCELCSCENMAASTLYGEPRLCEEAEEAHAESAWACCEPKILWSDADGEQTIFYLGWLVVSRPHQKVCLLSGQWRGLIYTSDTQMDSPSLSYVATK